MDTDDAPPPRASDTSAADREMEQGNRYTGTRLFAGTGVPVLGYLYTCVPVYMFHTCTMYM